MRLTVLGLFAVLAFLQYKLWFEEGSVKDVKALKEKVAYKKSELSQKKQSNKKMAQNIKSLKHNQEVVEALARKELGMTKPDESYYQILEK